MGRMTSGYLPRRKRSRRTFVGDAPDEGDDFVVRCLVHYRLRVLEKESWVSTNGECLGGVGRRARPEMSG